MSIPVCICGVEAALGMLGATLQDAAALPSPFHPQISLFGEAQCPSLPWYYNDQSCPLSISPLWPSLPAGQPTCHLSSVLLGIGKLPRSGPLSPALAPRQWWPCSLAACYQFYCCLCTVAIIIAFSAGGLFWELVGAKLCVLAQDGMEWEGKIKEEFCFLAVGEIKSCLLEAL